MDGLQLCATAHVKITKIDEAGNVVVEERTIDLTEEEAKSIWLLQQQA